MNPERYLRSFHVLGLLVGSEDGLRLTEIKDALQLPVSSVHNMLQTMVAAEVLNVTPDLRYTIGPRMVGVALSTVHSLDIRNVARRPLQALARKIGDDVYLGLRLGRRVFYADRCMGTQRISLDIRLGESLQLHSTATGKLFCALDAQFAQEALAAPLTAATPHTITDPALLGKELSLIRARGWAASRQEAVEGVVGYAIPIPAASGTVAAAIHVSVMASRASPAHEKTVIAAARLSADEVARGMGHLPIEAASAPSLTRNNRRSSIVAKETS